MKTQIASGRPTAVIQSNSQCDFSEHSNVRSKAKIALFPRRKLITSISQAVIATSLALSILTFVISLTEFLPMR